MKRFALLLLIVASVSLSGCAQSTTPEPVGGETHFLHSCDEAVACGGGLTCICGVCTKACAADDECSVLSPSASCVTSAESNGPACGSSSGSVCDVSCARDMDCASLGTGYRCDNGSCFTVDADDCTLPGAEATDFDLVALDPGCQGVTDALQRPGVELIEGDPRFRPTLITDVGLLGFYDEPIHATEPSIVRVGFSGARARMISPGPPRPDGSALRRSARVAHGCRVYWAESPKGDDRTLFEIHSALLGGGDERIVGDNPGALRGFAHPIVNDATHLYVGDLDGYYRVPIHGGDFELLHPAPAQTLDQLLSLPDRILLATNDGEETPQSSIVSIPKDTTVPPSVFLDGVQGFLATDGTDLYIGAMTSQDALENSNQDGAIMRVPLAGGSPTPVTSSRHFVANVDVDDARLYWGELHGDRATFEVWTIARDGSGDPTVLARDAVFLGASATHVYWTQRCEPAGIGVATMRIAKDAL